MGDILIRFGVDNLEINVLAREFCKEIESDIFRRLRVIQPAVGIFFNDDWAITVLIGRACHIGPSRKVIP